MMDGEISDDLEQEEKDRFKKEINKAAEKFYTMPIVQAFDLYYTIKIWLADDTKPIGPLYALDKTEQNALLGIKSTWYYSTPVINAESEELLKHLNPELKQLYLQDKNPVVLDKETSKKLCKGTVIGSAVCVVISGSIIGGLAGCDLLWSPLWMLGLLPGSLSGFCACQYYSGSKDCSCCRENNFLDI